jgi:DNA (cytosine-5)-methyltransferase 1
MKQIIHYDLFAGIGGFSYALDQVYEKEKIKHIFIEIDPFCQAVLKKHWQDGEFWGDIRDFIADAKRKRWGKRNISEERQVARQNTTIILTGGFPCQPFSQAGRRKGTADDRYLWGEMFEAIRIIKPDWVVAENVRGLITIQNGLVFEGILSDLESEGYAVQSFIIPACAVGAPHRRDRVWIIAQNTKHNRSTIGEDEKQKHIRNKRDVSTGDGVGIYLQKDASHPTSGQSGKQTKQEGWENIGGGDKDASNASSRNTFKGYDTTQRSGECTIKRKEAESSSTNSRCSNGGGIKERRIVRNNNNAWNKHWIEVASTLCNVAYGFPKELVRPDGSRDRNYSWWRTQALKAGGNAIVPQIAMRIFEAILYHNDEDN